MTEAHYFHPSPTAASAPGEVVLALDDVVLRLATDRQVFSPGAVDAGTRYLLLEAPPLPDAGTFVDLGAGYGPIALTMAARRPAATVWAVEVNERARALCTANAATAGLTNVRVVAPEQVPEDLTVDVLWSNPPIRIGKAALHRLLGGWFDRLAPTGVAVLVVHKHLGADSLARWIAAQGLTVRRLGSRQGYRLVEVRR